MKLKKVVAALAVVSMMMSSLAGCSSNATGETKETVEGTESKGSESKETELKETESAEGSSQASYTFPLEEPVEMSMLSVMVDDVELPDSLAFQKLEEKTNVKWDVQSAMGADMAEKRGLILASGEYPDVLFRAGLTDSDLEKYGKQGIFIPLNDLIDQYAPNLKAYLDERDGWKNITSSDGNIYALPNIGGIDPIMLKLWLNSKWIENVGMEEPTNLDEFYNVLKAFKEQDANGNGDVNDEIPLTCTDAATPEQILPYFGITYDLATKCAEIGDEYVYIPKTETYKEFIGYITKLYKEGLLDKNAFTQKHEQQGAIGQSADVLGSFFDVASFLAVGRERDVEYRALTPFDGSTYPKSKGINIGAMAITDKCKDPAMVMAWADQLYTEEGSRLAWMGVEGESYKMGEGGSWEWIFGKGFGDDIGTVRRNTTIQGVANHVSALPEIWVSGMTDPDEIYLYEESQRIIKDGKTYPVVRIAEENMNELAAIKADADSYIAQYIAGVATGELDLESSWEEYLTNLDNMGTKRMEEIYSEAYAANK